MAEMVSRLGFNRERMRRALGAGYLNATELADYLAVKGIPFRDAHHITGAAVGFAEKAGKALEELTLEELRTFSEAFDEDVFKALEHETAVSRRNAPGGTGPESVSAQIAELHQWLNEP